MKVVIYGIGTAGTKLAQTLYNEGQDIIVIDSDKKKIEKFQKTLDALCILGSMGNDLVVKQAKMNDAEVFIAVTDSDEENIVACLVAKKQGVKKTIARLRNAAYLDRDVLDTFEIGIDHIINPEREVAKEIFKLIKAPWATEVNTFIQDKLSLLEIRVNSSNTSYLNEKLHLLSATNIILVVSDVDSKKKLYFFAKGDMINVGDSIYILDKTENIGALNKIFEDLYGKIQNIVVMGGGQTAVELLTLLEGTDFKVKLIESSRSTCSMLNERFKKHIILCGDGTDLDLLVREKITKTDCFVAITGYDESNTMMSLFAQQKGVKKAITKIIKPYGRDILTGIGLPKQVDVYKITVNKILSFISMKQLIAVSILDNGLELMEFSVTPDSKITQKEMKGPQFITGATIAAVYRNGEAFFPAGSFKVEPNDVVLVFANKDKVSAVEEYFKSR